MNDFGERILVGFVEARKISMKEEERYNYVNVRDTLMKSLRNRFPPVCSTIYIYFRINIDLCDFNIYREYSRVYVY